MMPGPQLPNPDTEQGKSQLKFSMMTCEQQVSSKTFAYMKHIRPRRALAIDQQKGLVAMYPLFIHDGTRRGANPGDPPGMLQNLVTVETFGIRGGLIHEVEVFPLRDHPLLLRERLDAGLRTLGFPAHVAQTIVFRRLSLIRRQITTSDRPPHATYPAKPSGPRSCPDAAGDSDLRLP